MIKVFAWTVAVAFLAIGGPFLIALTIASVWSGTPPHGSFAAYLAYTVYVLGGALAAIWVGLHPSRLGAAALVALLVPSALSFAGTERRSRALVEEARTAVTAPDEQARERAAAGLMELGRRAGHQPHVEELLLRLRVASDDERRQRAVGLLGALAYENPPVLDELRALEEETRADPERIELHDSLVAAIRAIDPWADPPEAPSP